MNDLQDIIDRFEPITLAEMDGVKLQNRVDTKYVFGMEVLPRVLQDMRESYRLLEVDGVRGTSYRSLYYDTPDLASYHDHHNRRTFRSKVRFREYLGSGLVFLEVKRKTGRGRTDKARMPVEGIPLSLTDAHRRFIIDAGGADGELVPAMWNHFTRYTFVRRDIPERLTLDIGLRFSDPRTQRELGHVVVAELKQAGPDHRSPFSRVMRARGIRPSGMSKYCVGMLMLGRADKYNAFKPVLRMLDKIRSAA